MNHPSVRGYARSLARRVAADVYTTAADAVRAGYRIALGRLPTDDERVEALSFIRQQTASHRASGHADAGQLALADFCQVLMCLNEFVYVD
jgi:hypothetical protein